MLDLSFALPRLTRRPQVVASARRQAQAGARAAGNGARLAWSAVRFAREVAPRRPPRVPKGRTAPDLAAAALVGAGAEFLLDPADGKQRRKELLDRTRAATRRLGRQASQQASHARGVAAGAVHEATSSAT